MIYSAPRTPYGSVPDPINNNQSRLHHHQQQQRRHLYPPHGHPQTVTYHIIHLMFTSLSKSDHNIPIRLFF